MQGHSAGGDGAEVIYALRNTSALANDVLDELENTGQNVRKVYQRRLPSDTSKDYYFIHRNTGITEPIIVEYGFLDSTVDDVSQLKNNWQSLAEAVVKAVSDYTGIPYDQGNMNTYIVKSGDTLWSIAKKNNITVNELKSLNGLTSNSLSIGQVLKVSEQENTPTLDNTYVVLKGDTLYSIARKYGITVDGLKSANNLKTNTLEIGQILTIPAESENIEDYITYIVKSGDTLYAIAKSYNLTPNELLTYNNLNSTALSIGQTLKIPYKNIEEDTSNKEEIVEYVDYIVKKGDSLYSIARTYGITVNDIMKYNNLTTNLLNIGQVLKIPISEEEIITYTVKSGDSLYSIAREYNTTVDNLKQKNNLTSTLLSIGQILTI